MHRLYELETEGGETVVLIGICVGLTLLAGLVSGLTLGLMSLGKRPLLVDLVHFVDRLKSCIAAAVTYCAVLMLRPLHVLARRHD